MPKVKTKPEKKAQTNEARTVLYPEVRVELCIDAAALNSEGCKTLIGWTEEADGEKFGNKHIAEVSNLFKRKVRLANNNLNRPIDVGWIKTLAQEHLQRRWRRPLDSTIVLSKTGELMSGQHRCLSVIYAEMLRQAESHWSKNWPTEVTMEALVVYGVEEDDETFATINRVKTGSPCDTLYRSDYLRSLPSKARLEQAKMADHAIRMLWARTGCKSDPFSPTRTPAETLDFLARHGGRGGHLLKAVRHIWEEDQPIKIPGPDGDQTIRPISRFLSPGYAAAFLYLMASSTTDPVKYLSSDPPCESALDLEHWDRAMEFWTELASAHKQFEAVRSAILALRDPETGVDGSLPEKIAVLVKAWTHYTESKSKPFPDLTPDYDEDEDGEKVLSGNFIFGGVDLGKEKRSEETADESEEEDNDPKAVKRRQDAEEIIRRRQASSKKLADADVEARPDGSPVHKTMTSVKPGAADELAAIKKDHPDKLLMFRSSQPPFTYTAWGDDATTAAKVLGLKSGRNGELPKIQFFADRWDEFLVKLLEAGHKVARVEKTDGGHEVEDATPVKPKPVKKPRKKTEPAAVPA